MVLLLRSTHVMPEKATRTPVPAISHFVVLSFNHEKFEKVFNSFINSVIDFLS